MKIAIATDNYTRVAGHAGKARHWLLYMLHGYRPQALLPAPTLIKLALEQVMHHFQGRHAAPAAWTWWWPAAPARALSATCASAALTCC